MVATYGIVYRPGLTMGTDMIRRLAGLAFWILLGAPAHAEDMSPIVGLLAPQDGGVAFHATRGWQATGQRLRVLDDAGRPLCCLRVGRALAAPSDLHVDDAEPGARYAVTTEGKLAQRLIEGPVLAPVLNGGVKVGKTGSEQTHLNKHGRRWTLERCVTQEGLRLTISSAEQPGKTVYYFPLGYDVEPTCRKHWGAGRTGRVAGHRWAPARALSRDCSRRLVSAAGRRFRLSSASPRATDTSRSPGSRLPIRQTYK